MSTTVFNPTQSIQLTQEKKQGLLQRFFAWTRSQESNRLVWLGLALAIHGCALTPLTFIAVAFSGLNLTLIYIVMGAMAMALIPNLAAQPTRVTIPLFFLSVLVDLVILVYCFVIGFSAANVY